MPGFHDVIKMGCLKHLQTNIFNSENSYRNPFNALHIVLCVCVCECMMCAVFILMETNSQADRIEWDSIHYTGKTEAFG